MKKKEEEVVEQGGFRSHQCDTKEDVKPAVTADAPEADKE